MKKMSTSYHGVLKFGLKKPANWNEFLLYEAITISVFPYKKHPLYPIWAPDQLEKIVPVGSTQSDGLALHGLVEVTIFKPFKLVPGIGTFF